MTLPRRLAAEAIGTALLLAIVVGSGIMGERLSQGNDAIALLGNAIATGAGLAVLIFLFAPISGAHFNPVVTLIEAIEGRLIWREALAYVPVQIIAALAGVAAAHLMFGEALFTPTFAGIRPDGVLGFIVAQLLGAFFAVNFVKWLNGSQPEYP